jgi:nucleotide-binding universal stress UspA family protein
MTEALAWITDSAWHTVIDAIKPLAANGANITLHSVSDDEAISVVQGSFAGLLGRGRPRRDIPQEIRDHTRANSDQILADAVDRLGCRATELLLHGRTEHQVVRAAANTDLLVCARDGDCSQPGPRSLGRATRFVVDHASCPVLLVWPEDTIRTQSAWQPPPNTPPRGPEHRPLHRHNEPGPPRPPDHGLHHGPHH